jgi:hypothetical protein
MLTIRRPGELVEALLSSLYVRIRNKAIVHSVLQTYSLAR